MPQVRVEPAEDDRASVVRLLLASSLMLFLELALIRWLGANVVHLSYFSNFVLLGSFLGIGAGFLIAHEQVPLIVGDHTAGIQVLSTKNFPANSGPLGQVGS